MDDSEIDPGGQPAMPDDTATPPVEAIPAAAPAAAPVPPSIPAADPPPPKRSLEDSLAALDEDTKTFVLGELAKARKEAGDARGAARKQAADEARAELAQSIGKAIGLVQDEPVDPAALTQQLTVKDAETRQAKTELAIFRVAAAVQADPAALLDSRSFMTSVADMDPADTDAMTAAVEAAITANPAFKVAPARRVPAPTPVVGSSANGAPGIDEQIAAAKKAGDVKTWLHLENQKLAAPSR